MTPMSTYRYKRPYKRPWYVKLAIRLGSGGMIAFALIATIAVASVTQLVCGQMPSESKARHALENQGFTHIRLVKRHIWFVGLRGCGRDDLSMFEFRATNPIQHRVTVNVCEGILKGATIRG